VAAGLDPETFWRITPKEMSVHFAGAARRVRAEQKRLGWAAYQGAALSRTAKFPKFTDFMRDEKPKHGDPMSALRRLANALPKRAGGVP